MSPISNKTKNSYALDLTFETLKSKDEYLKQTNEYDISKFNFQDQVQVKFDNFMTDDENIDKDIIDVGCIMNSLHIIQLLSPIDKMIHKNVCDITHDEYKQMIASYTDTGKDKRIEILESKKNDVQYMHEFLVEKTHLLDHKLFDIINFLYESYTLYVKESFAKHVSHLNKISSRDTNSQVIRKLVSHWKIPSRTITTIVDHFVLKIHEYEVLTCQCIENELEKHMSSVYIKSKNVSFYKISTLVCVYYIIISFVERSSHVFLTPNDTKMPFMNIDKNVVENMRHKLIPSKASFSSLSNISVKNDLSELFLSRIMDTFHYEIRKTLYVYKYLQNNISMYQTFPKPLNEHCTYEKIEKSIASWKVVFQNELSDIRIIILIPHIVQAYKEYQKICSLKKKIVSLSFYLFYSFCNNFHLRCFHANEPNIYTRIADLYNEKQSENVQQYSSLGHMWKLIEQPSQLRQKTHIRTVVTKRFEISNVTIRKNHIYLTQPYVDDNILQMLKSNSSKEYIIAVKTSDEVRYYELMTYEFSLHEFLNECNEIFEHSVTDNEFSFYLRFKNCFLKATEVLEILEKVTRQKNILDIQIFNQIQETVKIINQSVIEENIKLLFLFNITKDTLDQFEDNLTNFIKYMENEKCEYIHSSKIKNMNMNMYNESDTEADIEDN